MIVIYKLEDDFKFHEYDTWDNGKFSGPLSGLNISGNEVTRQFNTSYYRTEDVKDTSKSKTKEKK